MRVAFVIMAYKYPSQLRSLLEHLKHPRHHFFIHIDKNVDIEPFQSACASVEDQVDWVEREMSYWGSYQCVKALLNGIRMAFENREFKFDYFVHLSGQDFPLKSAGFINGTLQQSAPTNFINVMPFPVQSWDGGGWDRIKNLKFFWKGKRLIIHPNVSNFLLQSLLFVFRAFAGLIDRRRRFYGGEFYFMLHRTGVERLFSNIAKYPVFFKRLQWVTLPEEILIQTMLMCDGAIDIELNEDIYRYINWNSGSKGPVEMTEENLKGLLDSSFLIGRKFAISDPDFKLRFNE